MRNAGGERGRAAVKNRVGDAVRRTPLASSLGTAWNRVPDRFRGWGPVLVVLAVAAFYPYYTSTLQDLPGIGDFFPRLDSAVIILVFTMMALGLNIVVGYAGLLDLGYVAFYAIGAYTAAWLASQQFEQVSFTFWAADVPAGTPGIHISIWLILVVALVITGLAGIIIGLPTLRLRGDYLAIVTLGFGEIIPQFFRNGDNLKGFDLTHGTYGITPIDSPGFGSGLHDAIGLPSSFQASFKREELFYYGIVALILITVFCSVRLRDSRIGRAWIAIREDETAAAAMGVPLMRTKTWAYALGASFGGVAGAYYASFKGGAFQSEFFFNISVFLLCMVILGGMGSVWGVLAGGVLLSWLNVQGLANIGDRVNETFGTNFEVTKYQFGIYGIAIVLVMLFRPVGLIPEGRRRRELEEGVHDTPLYDVTTEGSMTLERS